MSTRILLIAHAPLASALRDCALHVFPDCAHAVIAVDVMPDASPEESLQAAQLLLGNPIDQDTLVLTDVFGATFQCGQAFGQRHAVAFDCWRELAHVAAHGVL